MCEGGPADWFRELSEGAPVPTRRHGLPNVERHLLIQTFVSITQAVSSIPLDDPIADGLWGMWIMMPRLLLRPLPGGLLRSQSIEEIRLRVNKLSDGLVRVLMEDGQMQAEVQRRRAHGMFATGGRAYRDRYP